jgi:hypothetical protein
MLARKNQTLQDIVASLKRYHDSVDEEAAVEGGAEGPSQKEILQELIAALQSSPS